MDRNTVNRDLLFDIFYALTLFYLMLGQYDIIRNLIEGMERMASRDKVKFILNAFYCDYVPDWKVTYTSILNFVNIKYENHVGE